MAQSKSNAWQNLRLEIFVGVRSMPTTFPALAALAICADFPSLPPSKRETGGLLSLVIFLKW